MTGTGILPLMFALALIAGLAMIAFAVHLARSTPKGPPEPANPSLRLDQGAHKIVRIAEILEPIFAKDLPELRRTLMQSGYFSVDAPTFFLLAKIAACAVGLIAGAGLAIFVPQVSEMSPQARISIIIISGAVGFYVPISWIGRRRKKRIAEITAALPDAFDLMQVCIEAGQSLDQSLLRVTRRMQRSRPILAARFGALTESLAAGANRHEAFLRLAEETGSPDLRSFATIIEQSTTMGSPILQTLRTYAEDLRDRRAREVEARAATLPTKMTLGTMLFTLPPLLLLLLTPALFRIMQSVF